MKSFGCDSAGDKNGQICPFFQLGLCSLAAEDCPMVHEQKNYDPATSNCAGLQALADSLTASTNAAGDGKSVATIGKNWQLAEADSKKTDTNQNYLEDLSSVTIKSLCLDESGGAVSKRYKSNKIAQHFKEENVASQIAPNQIDGSSAQHKMPPPGFGHNRHHQLTTGDREAIPPLITSTPNHSNDIDNLKLLLEQDMQTFNDPKLGWRPMQGLMMRNSGPNNIAAAAAAIVDIQHFCYQCQRGGLVLTREGKCPVCKGEFVEVEDSAPQAGEWGAATSEKPGLIQPSTPAMSSDFSLDTLPVGVPPTRAPKIRKPGLPLRKPQASSVKSYYCYNCKTKAPFLCSNNSKCPTCKSDFVEEHETATNHLEAEKEAELKSIENVVQHKKAPRLSKYICHSCNKVSAVTKGHDIKCGHCHSDFVEEQTESNTSWADRVGTSGEARPAEGSDWKCHKCHKTNRLWVRSGETPTCPFCNSEFVEQVINEGSAGDAPYPTPVLTGNDSWNGASQAWTPTAIQPRHEKIFKTGHEFIQRATSGDIGAGMETAPSEETSAVPQPTDTTNLNHAKVSVIMDDIEAAATKLDLKLKRTLGEDYCFKMSQCCPKPFQMVRRGSATHDTLEDIHRKVKDHIRNVAVIIFNPRQGEKEMMKKGQADDPDFLPYDEAVTELSSAIQLLEKMGNNCYGHQNNRGGEYTLRIIRASCYVRCGELRAAKQDIALALAIHTPKDSKPYFLRGMILKRQGKDEEAAKDALEAVKLDPTLALKLTPKDL